MKTFRKSLCIWAVILLAACSANQSLQEYYVDNTENPSFVSFDIPTSVLNLDAMELTNEQKTAYESLRKLNILAFKKTAENTMEYAAEKKKVNAILANDGYEELMKMNTQFGRATIRFKGTDDAIEEVVVFGDNKDKGFALVRVLGKGMNPAHFVQLLEAMEKSNIATDGLAGLGAFLKE